MILDWPSELPRPDRDTWQAQRQDARRKRQGDIGPPAYRRRFSRAAKMVSLSITVDRNQKAIFDRFYEVDCAEGVHLFYMPDPTTDGWPLLTADGAPLLTGDGRPLLLGARWLCSWGDDVPTESMSGTRFKMSFSVVVIP